MIHCLSGIQIDLGFLYFCLLNLATPYSPRNVRDLKGSGGGSALLPKFPREGQGAGWAQGRGIASHSLPLKQELSHYKSWSLWLHFHSLVGALLSVVVGGLFCFVLFLIVFFSGLYFTRFCSLCV